MRAGRRIARAAGCALATSGPGRGVERDFLHALRHEDARAIGAPGEQYARARVVHEAGQPLGRIVR